MSSTQDPDPEEKPESKAGRVFDVQPGEADLWDLEDRPPPPRVPDNAGPQKTPKIPLGNAAKWTEDTPPPAAIPRAPRPPKEKEPKPAETPEPPPAAPEGPAAALPTTKPSPVRRKADDAFADLEGAWNSDPSSAPPSEPEAAAPEAPGPDISPEPEAAPAPAAAASPAEPEPPAQKPAIPTPKQPPIEPVQKDPAPATPGKPLLSTLEKIGIAAFLVIFLASGFFFLGRPLHQLPEKKQHLTPSDFPVKGQKVEASGFSSYWRKPAESEPVRRGTALVPVAEMKITGGPATVRVLFKNSSGSYVGDAITRQVGAEAALNVAATAGFEDPGMYASYRTGNTEPWMIEVLEGPAGGGSSSQFKKLFEIPISTERR